MIRVVPRRALFVLGASSALTACGFQPVYMRTASGNAGPAQRNLAAISVDLISDRPGQLLRQALQERFGSDAGNAPPRYKLAVGYSIAGQGIGIQQDSTPTYIRLSASANWTLRSADGAGTKVTSGTANASDGYDVLDQQYFAADLSTEQTDHRLANEVADEIALQLAVYFRRQAVIASR
ncbi:MAG TPA: LPS assembly lipoprotein LptE [Acetobacteraceae bacterium]|jgi:LPS-assembly lipoprotein